METVYINVDSINFFHGKNLLDTGQEVLVKLNWRNPCSFTSNKCTVLLWTGQLSKFFHQDLAELGHQAGSFCLAFLSFQVTGMGVANISYFIDWVI